MTSIPNDKNIAFIGAGNMAEAIVKGMLKSGVAEPSQICVTDTVAERTAYCEASFGVRVADDNVDAVEQAHIVVLAVKPQAMPEVLAGIAKVARGDKLFISIAAGVRCQSIEDAIGGKARVVRVMPNTPALVGEGMSGICQGSHATEPDEVLASLLMQAVGLVVHVDEKHMDAVTAVSGSGPAYVFYIMEAMLEAARGLGLDERVARVLVYQTISGAAKLADEEDGATPDELRARVTSKGGTTAAALDVLEQSGVKQTFIDAIKAARDRSIELSGS